MVRFRFYRKSGNLDISTLLYYIYYISSGWATNYLDIGLKVAFPLSVIFCSCRGDRQTALVIVVVTLQKKMRSKINQKQI